MLEVLVGLLLILAVAGLFLIIVLFALKMFGTNFLALIK